MFWLEAPDIPNELIGSQVNYRYLNVSPDELDRDLNALNPFSILMSQQKIGFLKRLFPTWLQDCHQFLCVVESRGK